MAWMIWGFDSPPLHQDSEEQAFAQDDLSVKTSLLVRSVRRRGHTCSVASENKLVPARALQGRHMGFWSNGMTHRSQR
jgi:hypothetical protein